MNDQGRAVLRLAVDVGMATILSTHFAVAINVTRTFRLGILASIGGGIEGADTTAEIEAAYQMDARHGRVSTGLRVGPKMHLMHEENSSLVGVSVLGFVRFMWDAGSSNAVGFGFDLGMSFFDHGDSLPQAHTGFIWETGA